MNNAKIEKLQERGLKIVYSDYDADYDELLIRFNTTTMLQQRLKKIILEVFKSIRCKNPEYLHDMFLSKDLSYSLRNHHPVIQPIKNSTNFGLRSIAYLGSNLWNNIKNKTMKKTQNLDEFRIELKALNVSKITGLSISLV